MNFFDEATLRLKQQLKVTEDKAVAEVFGMTGKAWTARKRRGSFPDTELLALIAKRPDLALDYDYITTGHSSKVYEQMAANMQPDPRAIGPRLTGAPAEYVELVGRVLAASRKGDAALQDALVEGVALFQGGPLSSQYIEVPRYDVTASAGGGAVIHDEAVVDHLAFKRDWIVKELGLDAKHLALITIRGDSMLGTINSGDLVLLDTRPGMGYSDGIYVIQLHGALLCKRLHFKLTGVVEVMSDNKAYATEVVSAEELGRLTVVGRVVWHGRRV